MHVGGWDRQGGKVTRSKVNEGWSGRHGGQEFSCESPTAGGTLMRAIGGKRGPV